MNMRILPEPTSRSKHAAISRRVPSLPKRRCVCQASIDTIHTRSSSIFHMSFRGLDARGTVALAIMSAALLSLANRSGAFRRVPLLHRSICGFTRNSRNKDVRKGRCCGGISGSSRGAHTRELGPEGTALPDVMHKVISAEELKVSELQHTIRKRTTLATLSNTNMIALLCTCSSVWMVYTDCTSIG